MLQHLPYPCSLPRRSSWTAVPAHSRRSHSVHSNRPSPGPRPPASADDGVLTVSLLKRCRRGHYATGTTNANTWWRSVWAAADCPPGEALTQAHPPTTYYWWGYLGASEGQKSRGGLFFLGHWLYVGYEQGLAMDACAMQEARQRRERLSETSGCSCPQPPTRTRNIYLPGHVPLRTYGAARCRHCNSERGHVVPPPQQVGV